MRLELVCDAESTAGYAAHARLMIRALSENAPRDLKMRVVSRQKDPTKAEISFADAAMLRDLTSVDIGKPDVRLIFEPANWLYTEEGVKTISFCQWETTKIRNYNWQGRQENNWVAQLNKADMVLSSSRSAIKAFRDSGVTVEKMQAIPGPIYPHGMEGCLPVRGLSVGRQDKVIPRETWPVVVGYMGQWCTRKNPEAFIRDVTCAFKKGEAVALMKFYGSPNFDDGDRIKAAVQAVRASCRKEDAPDFFVITEPLTDLEVLQFFNTIDIYFAPARGEGFSMPVSMACAANKHVIVPEWGGPSDYVPGHLLIPGVFMPAVGMSSFDCDQYWFDIDEKAAIERLREMHAQVKAGEPPVKSITLAEHVMGIAGPSVFAKGVYGAIESVLK